MPVGDERQAVDVLEELPGEAALADPRETDDRDEVCRAIIGDAVEGLFDEAQLAVAADERRFQSLGLERTTCAGDDPQGAEEREEALLALKLVRAGVLVGDRLLGCATRGVADVYDFPAMPSTGSARRC